MFTMRIHLPQPSSEVLGAVLAGMAGSGTSLVGCCFLGLELPGGLEGGLFRALLNTQLSAVSVHFEAQRIVCVPPLRWSPVPLPGAGLLVRVREGFSTLLSCSWS